MTEISFSLKTGEGFSEMKLRIEHSEEKSEKPELGKMFSSRTCSPAQWVKQH